MIARVDQGEQEQRIPKDDEQQSEHGDSVEFAKSQSLETYALRSAPERQCHGLAGDQMLAVGCTVVVRPTDFVVESF